MSKVYDPILCMMVDKPATRTTDASTGHKVVSYAESYLNSIGKSNSTGRYDKIVQGVRSILRESLLDDVKLKSAVEREVDRLLKKYSMNDAKAKARDVANLKELKDDYGRLKNASSIIGNIYSLSSSTKSAILKAIESGMREIDTRIDQAYMK